MNIYYLGSALNLAALYMIAGLGASLSIKSGEFNLGGEGQIYVGGFIAAIILNALSSLPAPVAIIIALIASFIASGLMSFVCILIKKYKNADYLFTTFILSLAVIPFIDGLITGPCRADANNLLATPFINESFQLPSILPPSTLNISLPLAIIICLGFAALIYKTAYGRRLCVYGISPRFAKYSGYSLTRLSFSSAFISGGMHGLCGLLVIIGTYYTCHLGFFQGMGWNALSAALIAKANPIFLIPSSFFMAFITTYANKFALYHNLGFDISGIIQAVILFLISFPLFMPKNKEEA